MSRLRRTTSILFFLTFFVASGQAVTQELTPDAVVGRFQEGLLGVMKEAKGLSVQQRYDRLEPLIEETFHLNVMVGFATGTFWRSSSMAQRGRLVRAFKRMNISTLATLFDGYSGEVFEIVEEKPGPKDLWIVETRLVSTDGSSVDIAYIAQKRKGLWRLVDVVVDAGISELRVRRSEYNHVLKKDGVEGLIAVLNRKADELTAQ